MSKRTLVTALTAVAALLVSVFAAPGAGARARSAAACTPKSNIEVIVDDSGSMSITDPNRLRAQAAQLIIESQSQVSKAFTLGGVSFGTDATTLFPPGNVVSNRTAMESSLSSIQADDGTTNYGAAFTKAASDNPGRQAQIFMTDGGNNGDPIPLPQPPTYIIGFGDSAADPQNVTDLNNLASSSGGQYFPQTDSSHLVSVTNQVLNLITCQATASKTQNITLKKVGQTAATSFSTGRTTKSVHAVVSWANPSTQIKFVGATAKLKGTVYVTSAKAKRKKMKVGTRSGATFQSILIHNVPKHAKLKLRFKAIKIGAPDPNAPTLNPGAATVTMTSSTKK